LTEIKDWHAHVYFDAGTSDPAKQLREAIEQKFSNIVMGRWHEKPVGPHPSWSYQVAFPNEIFGELVPWLTLNHLGLTVFVHPNTGEDIPDHTEYALWIGTQCELNLDSLR